MNGPTQQFKIKIPWWAMIVGSVRRWFRERADRRRALISQRTPIYQGTLVGKSTWTTTDVSFISHQWDCFETPAGERSAKFTAGNCYAKEIRHDMYSRIVLPWLHGKVNIDWRKTRSENVVHWSLSN